MIQYIERPVRHTVQQSTTMIQYIDTPSTTHSAAEHHNDSKYTEHRQKRHTVQQSTTMIQYIERPVRHTVQQSTTMIQYTGTPTKTHTVQQSTTMILFMSY